jgi:putative spermidine/putrescine transport system ATP-binding protein
MIELRGVTARYGAVVANDRLDLVVRRGELLTLLGPSGCGKTTALRTLTGHVQPEAGRVLIDGRDVTDLPTHRRELGMVFQNFALFPHMTVRDNVGFPLMIRGVSAAERAERVAEALRLVRLEGHADKAPRQLSGGQQQRVGLARALVYRPKVLLLDEPLSNLDAKLREEMRFEIRDVVTRLGVTAMYVTHDQEEALALSHRVVVMNEGRVEQVGTPSEVYEDPATAFVAKFLGEANVLPARVVAVGPTGLLCDIGGGRQVRSDRKADVRPGQAIEVIVRAERVRLAERPSGLANSFPATLEHVLYLGGDLRYLVRLGDHRLVAVEKNRGDGLVLRAGQAIHVEWPGRESLVAPTP